MAEDKVRDGADLLGFVRGLADPATMSIEEELGHGYVRLKVTEAERRQALQDIRCVEDVVKELVRNARDAGAFNIYVSFQKERGRWRHVSVLDDGSGIPPSLHRKIFEARVTSKVSNVVEDTFGVHGRGMALFSIRHVVEDIALVDSREGAGTIIRASIDTEKLPEKKDQSTFPLLESGDGGETIIAGGPRNVPRVLTEFALQSNRTLVYMGSNAEILATLYHKSGEARKLWASGAKDLKRPLWFELGGIKEGRTLQQFAEANLGLAVSERNAFRILEFEIQPLMSINELLAQGELSLPIRRADLHHRHKSGWNDQLTRRISQQDLSSLCGSLEKALGEMGEKYFLVPETPVVKRRKNRLIISVALREMEEG